MPAVQSAPKSFESLRGVSGYPRKVGRTLRAVLATINDLDLVLSPGDADRAAAAACAAAHGGSRAAGSILRDYQAVTGVTVSGGGDLTRSLTFRIAGTKAAKGTLVLSSRGLVGRVGGEAGRAAARRPRRRAPCKTTCAVRDVVALTDRDPVAPGGHYVPCRGGRTRARKRAALWRVSGTST